MLLIREMLRLVRSTCGYARNSGRVWIIVVIIAVAIIAFTVTSVTVVGPVAIYPFL